MQICPVCNEKLDDGAKFCLECGFKMENAKKTPKPQKVEKYSKAQMLLAFWLLNIATFNLYTSWWILRKSAQMKEAGIPTRPFLRLVGTAFPIASLWCVHLTLRDAKNLVEKEEIKSVYDSGGELAIVYCASNGLFLMASLSVGGIPGFALSIASVLILTYLMSKAQENLNLYWQKKQPSLPIRGLNALEVIVVLVGGLVYLEIFTEIIFNLFH